MRICLLTQDDYRTGCPNISHCQLTKVLFRTTFTWMIILNLLIKKCLLSTLMGVRLKQVGFRKNVRAFPREKENCP